MQPTVNGLLHNAGLGLRLLTGANSERLTAPISWIHSSDLADPTPFLDAGQLVLTTGTQFAQATATRESFESYVERLAGAGLLGIGFGTEVIQAGTPDGLIAACERFSMPLFEVPYRVPFIAVIRSVADLIAEAAHARDAWALNAQRAISFAALRPDAIGSVLQELSRQLGRWVRLYDSRGHQSATFDEASALGRSELLERVDAEAQRLIARGQRSSSTISDPAGQVSLQTLGRRGALRGVLATAGAGPLDAADQTVVTSVVALAGLALEQNRELGRARGRLRSGLFQSLLEGNVAPVRRIVEQMGGALPVEPVRFVVLRPSSGSRDALFTDLEARDAEFTGELFFAASDGRVVISASSDAAPALAAQLSRLHGLAAGLSEPMPWVETATGVSQAVRALEKAGEASVLGFSDIVDGSLSGLLRETAASEVARALLRPVREHDAGTTLIESARVWLEHNGAWDPAAKQLGIHRHTLKSRVALVEKLTGRPLAGFDARTNLWLALELE
ncbi:PucR family transcriptional regulator [Mycetocola zhadangensis]|uniref:PucR family transcriptional regulator n=1 Tax=Mycetocola zhadangensis TaxID=1164595 RepID=A0A3L7IVS2_9MICO|nr:PucR family transcriptional regulator [Mycetocola zhadangensis]RLQ81042.1 PucR family transcriptional regulator [Mycetocola zhadangensis]GGF04255.1 PucR family transcriptional regulator [Mycetocola zhadangensis]